VQPAEELGLIDGIDQVEAYIQRNYGDQARTGTVYFCCSFYNKLFLFTDSIFKKEYLMEKPVLTFQKIIFTMKWIFTTSLLSSIWRDKLRLKIFLLWPKNG
jgi:hypothetical protein